jgi:methionine-rich copper-binding protein CopC
MRKLTALLLPLLGMASDAHAHSELKTAEPSARAILKVSPQEVRLVFSEKIEPRFSSIEVLDPTGRRVSLGETRGDPSEPTVLVVGLMALPAGHYRVIWRVVSIDTHKTSGGFVFTIEP